MKAIIELLGEADVGKTTLTTILGEELASASILYIDASLNQHLTQSLAPKPSTNTVAQLLKQAQSGNREVIDWAFHDLTIEVGEEGDLLTLGSLPNTLSTTEQDRFRYGLTRLVEAYDYVIIDGFHPLLHHLMPEESLRTVIILTPRQMVGWSIPPEVRRTPSIVLNQYGGEALSPELEMSLQQGQALLIGKLPRYATPEDCAQHLTDDFRNCILRLNIPLNFTHS